MSHHDDIDWVFWGEWPKSPIGFACFLVLAIGATWWACNGDEASKAECVKHGETYVDSRTGYTICETDGGVVVKR